MVWPNALPVRSDRRSWPAALVVRSRLTSLPASQGVAHRGNDRVDAARPGPRTPGRARGRPDRLSLPSPPSIWSAPVPPLMNVAAPPSIASLPVLPAMASSPGPPSMNRLVPPSSVSLPAPPSMVSMPSPPLTVSLPPSPEGVAAVAAVDRGHCRRRPAMTSRPPSPFRRSFTTLPVMVSRAAGPRDGDGVAG